MGCEEHLREGRTREYACHRNFWRGHTEEGHRVQYKCQGCRPIARGTITRQGRGPLYTEVTSALYGAGITSVKAVNYVYGVGGRDVKTDDIERVYHDLQLDVANGIQGTPYRYLGLKG